ncbi:MAG: hypothetical protein ACLRIS_02380 [Flavonifractor plautii]
MRRKGDTHGEIGALYPGGAGAAALRLHHRHLRRRRRRRGRRPAAGGAALPAVHIDTPAGVRVEAELLEHAAGDGWPPARCARTAATIPT